MGMQNQSYRQRLRSGQRDRIWTGNLSFTSLNLPRLAIKAKGDIDMFF